MQVSENGYALIRRFEGLRLTAYRDVAGVVTIGYGTTRGVKMGMTITKAEAERLMQEDVARFDGYLEDLVKVPLNQNQYDALACFVYNLGPANLESSTLLRVLNEGKYDEAGQQFKRWNKARVGGRMVEVKGLTARRAAEAALFGAPC